MTVGHRGTSYGKDAQAPCWGIERIREVVKLVSKRKSIAKIKEKRSEP